MPAPALVITPPSGPFTYIVAPVDKDHFRISISLSQATATSDWSVGVSVGVISGELSSIPVEDRSALMSGHSIVIPFNEASSLAAVAAKVQAYVDSIYDNLIPNP